MTWYHWLATGSAAYCLLSCLAIAIRLIRLGRPIDYSRKRGSTAASIYYAFTGAMSPHKKESAYLHLPTYTAGLCFHLGTFASLPVFILLVAGIIPGPITAQLLAAFFALTGICGFSILLKRLSKEPLRRLSNPDDFIANILVTLAHWMTALVLLDSAAEPAYYLLIALLFLYFPLGKLKHTVYFFAARYHLGFFYGWRGIWPPKTS